MNTDRQELEDVRKKCVELDHELNTFFQALKEIKEIRDVVGNLPDKLRQNEEEMEHQKVEIEALMSSVSNLLIAFEEQSKGLFFDMEKKTELLVSNTKSSISELKNVFELNSEKLHEAQKERLEQVTTIYEQIQNSFGGIKDIINSHEQSIDMLKSNYMEILKMTERVEASFHELQKYISVLQKRPYDIQGRVNAMEERLRAEFFAKLESQKKVILAMLAVLVISVIVFIFYPE